MYPAIYGRIYTFCFIVSKSIRAQVSTPPYVTNSMNRIFVGFLDLVNFDRTNYIR